MPQRGTMQNQSSRPVDKRVKRAREFRHDPTEAEKKLWRYLRQLSPDRSHFRRQASIGPYFADFACHQTRIVIEVDGGQHADSESDARRTRYLEANGYRVLRFWNNDVLGNIEGVVETIMNAVGAGEGPPPPTPPHQRSSTLDLRGRGARVASALLKQQSRSKARCRLCSPPTRSCGGEVDSSEARISGVGGRCPQQKSGVGPIRGPSSSIRPQ
jgi:very-short-patch-repair endonuclease